MLRMVWGDSDENARNSTVNTIVLFINCALPLSLISFYRPSGEDNEYRVCCCSCYFHPTESGATHITLECTYIIHQYITPVRLGLEGGEYSSFFCATGPFKLTSITYIKVWPCTTSSRQMWFVEHVIIQNVCNFLLSLLIYTNRVFYNPDDKN